MDRKDLADLIFPDSKPVEYYNEKYKPRELPEGALVTRYAPSPTGFNHIGGVMQAMISQKLAKQTGGVSIVRIEDTDQKREVENAAEQIMSNLKDFDLLPDESILNENEKMYGPYKQSHRKDLYQAFAKDLIEKGLAYPCFCSPEDLDEIRSNQEKAKERTGYYGKWTKCRNMPVDMAIEKIKNGDPYIIRFKSNGNPDKKMIVKDVIKGNIEMPENDQDIVIIKSDGLPTFHFAHAIDDHFMGVNLVNRSDEWIPSVPLHIQLFCTLGFKVPKYAHTAPMMKMEGESRRKLSKRKDPEANAAYYREIGIPKEAVKEYLMNIANSNFEMWRKQNPDKPMDEFTFDIKKMGVAGALFDLVKMLDVSKNTISRYSTEELYEEALDWSKEYDKDLENLLNNKEYSLKVLGIERNNAKPRKDIAKWSDLRDAIIYMYEFDKEKVEFDYQKITDKDEINKIVSEYFDKYYNENDDKETWFNKMKDLAESLGYAREVKEYKQNPDGFKGHIGDISTVIRVKLTGRSQTPDLYEIMQVLGKEEILKRI